MVLKGIQAYLIENGKTANLANWYPKTVEEDNPKQNMGICILLKLLSF